MLFYYLLSNRFPKFATGLMSVIRPFLIFFFFDNYEYLPQNWNSDGHFEVLNGYLNWFISYDTNAKQGKKEKIIKDRKYFTQMTSFFYTVSVFIHFKWAVCGELVHLKFFWGNTKWKKVSSPPYLKISMKLSKHGFSYSFKHDPRSISKITFYANLRLCPIDTELLSFFKKVLLVIQVSNNLAWMRSVGWLCWIIF